MTHPERDLMLRSLCTILGILLLPATVLGLETDYLREVKPILRARCFSCHGSLAQKARLRLDTRSAILKGGRKGPAIMPGAPQRSLLVERICASEDSERMPPEGPALSSAQIEIIKKWIREGARGPG